MLVNIFLLVAELALLPLDAPSISPNVHAAAIAGSPKFVLSNDELKRFPSRVPLELGWFEKWALTPPGSATATTLAKSSPLKSKASKTSDKGKGKGGGTAPKTPGGFGAATKSLFCKAPTADVLTVVRGTAADGSTDGMAGAGSPEALRAWGGAARRAIEEHIVGNGAVLLRGLPMRSAEEFAHFWKGCLDEEAPVPLVEGRYTSLGPAAGREKISGIDLATNVPPDFLLLNHNELCYNPTTVGRIGLYCVQDAPSGGESTLARNCDLGTTHSASVRQFLEEHGGIRYSRVFFDARNPPPPQVTTAALGSWQGKCALPDDAPREAAVAFFLEMGFLAEELIWDINGCLTVTNVHPGYVRDASSGVEVWWNIVHTGSLTAADGTPFPPKLVAEVQRTAWEHTYAFKLHPGDWLMLDNMRVQHGRLPYEASSQQKRVLLTVYSSPCPSC